MALDPAPHETWYGTLNHALPRGVVQLESSLQDTIRCRDRSRFTLPEGVLRLAHTEYEHQYGHQQDYERMQERGGLGVLEVVALLADLAERFGAKPTEPRKS